MSNSTSKTAKKTGTKKSYRIADNDNLSDAFGDQIPEEYRGSDQFLDVVTWNIRYFHDRDQTRVARIAEVMNALNADIFVCEEILEGALDPVAQVLEKKKAGYYQTAYGTTGGQQRVALMWDIEWVRAKDNITELFGKGQITASDGKDCFPRLPLLGVFTSLTKSSDIEANTFDFQLLGLHLKSQRGDGSEQRELAAKSLTQWLTDKAPLVDADVIMLGDWNAPPSSPAWRPFQELENAGKAAFQSINDEGSISHLMYKNKQNFGSRLDLEALSKSTVSQLAKPPEVVRWKGLDQLIASNPKGQAIKDYIAWLGMNVSDHMPVVTRFYFTTGK